MKNEYEPLPTDSLPILRVLVKPADQDAFGVINGGWLMQCLDQAGSACAREADEKKGRFATRAVNAFQCLAPIEVGDWVSIYAYILRVGKTSITVRLDAFVQKGASTAPAIRVTDATMTYVALPADA